MQCQSIFIPSCFFIASDTSESPLKMILAQLENDNILTDNIASKYVIKYWPQSLFEGDTISLRDALFSAAIS